MNALLRRHPLGFYEIAEKPSREELRNYYALKYYQTNQGNYRAQYDQEELDYFNSRIARYARVVEKIRGTSPGLMLDVGCGEGFAMQYFLAKNWKVEGLDFSAAGVQKMNPSCLPYLETGDVFDLLSTRVQNGRRYDAVFLSNVLEHVLEPVELMAQLRDLLSTDGVLIVTVPNDFSDLQNFCLERGHIDREFWIATPDHLSYFDADSLRAVGISAGYFCRNVLGEFPIDWFLLHPNANYVMNRENGPGANRARIQLDNLLARKPIDDVIAYYEAMAKVGMGRQVVAFFTRGQI
ncbi:MAG: class I SAM-dependent methyltransferase [Paraburkholderia sp.]|uniref:class I SAM-dependent methyltransferase n=1 Tax=Paraburkholderia sp. TaxID=1926495 RepID=UPI0012187BB9|nr:class I SAM-dependent methyltransferase [Paraburkholderia sp.]TAM06628.1 MAG: class I SAM-dependent methyltransferase [Paraburkholderia sp.]TAM28490.1 MAG: class I SAM-dependent methyltransferase [Paraburkholderia sp.]